MIAAWLNDPLFDEEDMVASNQSTFKEIKLRTLLFQKMPDVFLMMTKDATEVCVLSF